MQLILIIIALFSTSLSIAHDTHHNEYHGTHRLLAVPFQNITLGVHGSLGAYYSFGSHVEICCYTVDFSNDGIVSWTLNGIPQAGYLPVLMKKKGTSSNGQPADYQGILRIQNTTNQNIIVSCDFGFLRVANTKSLSRYTFLKN